MGLYLCIFDGKDELDGVEIGPYEVFDLFRRQVVQVLESGKAGSRFPILIGHSDCNGIWSPEEAGHLETELMIIAAESATMRPISLTNDWQKKVSKAFGHQMKTLYDCFFDVDCEPLLERLISLAKLSQARKLPILFQ